MARVLTRLTSFFLKYFHRYLIDKPGTLDAASGLCFLGRNTERVLSDRDLVKRYRGHSRCSPARPLSVLKIEHPASTEQAGPSRSPIRRRRRSSPPFSEWRTP